MILETIPGLESLSDEQKVILASELWENAAGVSDDPRDDAIFALLEKRWTEFEALHETGGTWDELKARLLKERHA